MKIYEIVNLTNICLYLEDIGIRLEGKNQRARITEDQLNGSRSIAENRKMISITPISVGHNTMSVKPFKPVWPTSRNIVPPSSKPGNVKAPSAALPVSNTEPASLSVTVPDKIDNLLSKMDTLVNVLQKGSENVHSTIASNSPIQKSSETHVEISDPVFIPSKILPDSTEVNMTATEANQERPDIVAATAALKKLKKKK